MRAQASLVIQSTTPTVNEVQTFPCVAMATKCKHLMCVVMTTDTNMKFSESLLQVHLAQRPLKHFKNFISIRSEQKKLSRC